MKPNLIFVHGGPGFKDYLKPFFMPLNEKFQCIFYDQLRGPQVTIAEMLSQLGGLISPLSGEKIIVGHSWGGILGIEYAAKRQSQLSGLVMMSTGLTHNHWKDEFHKELRNLNLEGAEPDQIYLAPEEVQDGSKFLEETWQTFSLETFKSISDTYVATYDVTSLLKSLKMPIINIFGEKDVRFPTRISKTFRTFNSRIIDCEIPNAGHFPFLMEPGRIQIYRILEDVFLKGPRKP